MKVLRWLDEWAEEFCVSIMLSLLILLLGTEVFSRFLLSKSFSWIEELCRYLFVWASYLGVAIAVKRKEQLRVLMLMDTLEKHFPRLVKVCYVVSELSFAVFCVLVFYYSINMLENMTRFKQVSASLEINVMYAYLIIPISMAVTTACCRACTAISGTIRSTSRAGGTKPCCLFCHSSSSCCLACLCSALSGLRPSSR